MKRTLSRKIYVPKFPRRWKETEVLVGTLWLFYVKGSSSVGRSNEIRWYKQTLRPIQFLFLISADEECRNRQPSSREKKLSFCSIRNKTVRIVEADDRIETL